MRSFHLSLFFLLSLTAFSQKNIHLPDASSMDKLTKGEDTLAFLAYSIVNDTLPEDRFFATRELILTLVRTLQVKGSFYYKFPNVKAISIQYPPDSSFRMFTWQLTVAENDYRYYGALQLKADSLVLFPLIDRSFNLTNPEKLILSPEKWMGCLIYGIQQMGQGEKAVYLAFGYDANDSKTRKKWIEPIRFVQNKPVFGAPIFPPVNADSSFIPVRFILNYAAESTIKLNYDAQLDLIVFDHLTPLSVKPGQPEIMVSDGSYEAFKIHPDRLEYIEMLPVVTTDEENLRPKPILDREGKDIFGKSIPEKKKKGGN